MSESGFPFLHAHEHASMYECVCVCVCVSLPHGKKLTLRPLLLVKKHPVVALSHINFAAASLLALHANVKMETKISLIPDKDFSYKLCDAARVLRVCPQLVSVRCKQKHPKIQKQGVSNSYDSLGPKGVPRICRIRFYLLLQIIYLFVLISSFCISFFPLVVFVFLLVVVGIAFIRW